MLQFLSLLSLAVVLVNGSWIPQIGARSDGPAPLALDFTVSKTVGNTTAEAVWAQFNSDTQKRSSSYREVVVPYKDISYHIDVYLGSNKQKNTLSIDTGSSDLWIYSDGYNPSSSTTSKDTGEAFSIEYVDGSGSQGEYYLDTMQFETTAPVLSNFQFARAGTTGYFGVLGVANRNQETTSTAYDNLPWALQKQGLTAKASYSLYLGREGESGSIIFGGIDTAKYTGDLVKYSIDQDTGSSAINLASATCDGTTTTINSAYTLDSGTSMGLADSALMAQLDKVFDTTVVNIGGIQYRQVNCNQPSDKYLDLNFGSNTISIPYSDLLFHQTSSSCLLGFGYYNDYKILGDVFLRHMYVYYDLTDETISVAQASYSDSSNIISA